LVKTDVTRAGRTLGSRVRPRAAPGNAAIGGRDGWAVERAPVRFRLMDEIPLEGPLIEVTTMTTARLVNSLACRTYAVLAGALAALYLAASGVAFYWIAYGVPESVFGRPVASPYLIEAVLPKFAAGILGFGVVYALLAVLAWKRYVAAVIVSFAIAALLLGTRLAGSADGLGAHITETAIALVLGLVMVVAIATRRRANPPAQA
jgi:hypothetical protein